jgi:hypothetical protein
MRERKKMTSSNIPGIQALIDAGVTIYEEQNVEDTTSDPIPGRTGRKRSVDSNDGESPA